MSDYRPYTDQFISDKTSLFSHPRLSHQRIDSQIEYFSSALSDLHSRAGQLAEENTQLHHLLKDKSQQEPAPSLDHEQQLDGHVPVPEINGTYIKESIRVIEANVNPRLGMYYICKGIICS